MARLQTREDGDKGLLLHVGWTCKKGLKKLAKKRGFNNKKQFAEKYLQQEVVDAYKSGEIK